MDYFLTDKQELEDQKWDERAGMINLYTCAGCRRSTMYTYIDSGFTPKSITCPGCGNLAFSQLAVVTQPIRFWYRPDNLEEIRGIVDDAWEAGLRAGIYKEEDKVKIKGQILANFVDHYNKGGLFSETIVR